MKKILLTITVFLVTLLAVAQSPNLLNYQGVARNSVGNVLPSQPIGLRLSVLSGSPTGPAVYTETRNVTTNAFGLFNVQVGSPGAITTTGTIAGINWTAFGVGSGTKFLQVEIDPVGGTNYFNVGSTQLVSVPYSLYAAAAAPVGPAGGDLTGTYPNPQIFFPLIKTFNATTLTPANTQLLGLTNSATTGTLGAITGTSASNDANATAILGTMSSTSPGGFSAAVKGVNNGTGGLGIGVWGGQAGSGWGVYGTAPNGWGVNGLSTSGIGVNGASTSGAGVAGTSTSAAGVSGTSTSGAGVAGISNTSNAGSFQNTNAANTASTVVGNSNGSGASVEGTNTGTGRGGFFQVLNAASTADALRAETNGSGASWAIRGISSGTNGAGLFQQTNASNTSNNLQSNQAGLGRAGLFNSTNAASTANAVDVNVAGTGFALRAASTNASPKALQTAGGVQLTGIGEANNLILKSDAVGNANWATPASVGIVTGTGTLNFVPKWTPNTTNLGNSQIFDDGTNVGIGTITPGQKLTVVDAGNSNIYSGTLSVYANNLTQGVGIGYAGIQALGSNPDQSLFFNARGGAPIIMQTVGTTGNVGIGTNTAQHKLSVGSTVADAQTVMVRGFGGGPLNWKGGGAFGNTNASAMIGELNGVATVGGHNNNLSAWTPFAINPVPGNNVGIGTAAPAYALDVDHNGANGLHVRSLLSYSVVDLDAANGDAALRYQNAGTTRWNVRNAPGSNDYQIVRNNSLPANVTINNGTGYVGIVQTSPAYQLDVLNAGANGIRSKSSSSFSIVDIDAANGDQALRLLNNGAGDWHIGGGLFGGLDFFDMKTGQNRMLIQNVTGNVGIGTNSPTASLQVTNANTSVSAQVEQTNAANTNNAMFIDNANATSAPTGASLQGGAGLYVRKGTGSTLAFGNPSAVISSINTAAGVGVLGLSDGANSFALAGVSNGAGATAVLGQAAVPNSTALYGLNFGGPTGRALLTVGEIQLTGIGEAAGRVLTSDATGVASWQTPVTTTTSVGISLRNLTGTINIPNGVSTPITQWSNVLYENGGSNYNNITGEYTISATGIYTVHAALLFDPFPATGNLNSIRVFVDGSFEYEEFFMPSTGGYLSAALNYTRNFTAGQRISIQVQQNTGSTIPIGSWNGNNFSVTKNN